MRKVSHYFDFRSTAIVGGWVMILTSLLLGYHQVHPLGEWLDAVVVVLGAYGNPATLFGMGLAAIGLRAKLERMS